MNQVLQIAKREIIQRGLNKATVITTILIALVFGVGGTVAAKFLGQEAEPEKIAVTADTQEIGSALKAVSKQMASSGAGVLANDSVAKRVPSAEVAKKQVKDGTADYALVKVGDQVQLLSNGPASLSLSTTVRQVVASAELGKYVQDIGGNVNELNERVNNVQFKTVDLSEDSDDDSGATDHLTGYFVSLVALLLLFMIILTAGQVVALGVVEEKSSRIVEVLLGAVSPSRLLLGKVLGVAVMALAQLVIMGSGAIVGGMALIKAVDIQLDVAGIWFWALPPIFSSTLVWAPWLPAAKIWALRSCRCCCGKWWSCTSRCSWQ